MNAHSRTLARWWTVVIFAVAMAWVESAVVFYLRLMIDRLEPYQPNPLPFMSGLGEAELVREASTLIMLLATGWLAGRNWRTRLGYAVLAFGIWDIFYYVFLKVLCGWPNSLWDWDILFLLPLPWWGPVLAPVLIAMLMAVWGTLVTQVIPGKSRDPVNWRTWGCSTLGVGLALYIFMADSIRVAGDGTAALRNMLPTSFPWPLFLLALAMMAAPLLPVCRQITSRKSAMVRSVQNA